MYVCVLYTEGIGHPEELSLARLLSADELKRNQGVSATRRSRPTRTRSRSSGGHQYVSTASILDSVHGSSLQLGSPGRRTPSMFTSRVRPLTVCSRDVSYVIHSRHSGCQRGGIVPGGPGGEP